MHMNHQLAANCCGETHITAPRVCKQNTRPRHPRHAHHWIYRKTTNYTIAHRRKSLTWIKFTKNPCTREQRTRQQTVRRRSRFAGSGTQDKNNKTHRQRLLRSASLEPINVSRFANGAAAVGSTERYCEPAVPCWVGQRCQIQIWKAAGSKSSKTDWIEEC